MPVSGNEEMVKPIVGQFSEYTAGIPIKKRRFPFILSSSQPTKDSPSLPTDNELMNKRFSSPLPVSTVSNGAASSNTSGIVASSKTSVINAGGVAASLNAGSVAANSNALGVAMSSTVSSVFASSNASSVAMSSTAGSVAASSNASGVAMCSASTSVVASLNAGIVAATSNFSGSVSAGSSAGAVASSSSAASVAMSSTSISVAASLNAGSVVESSNASGVGMSSTAISVIAGPIVSSMVEGLKASSVAGSVSASVLGFSYGSEKSVLEKEKRSSDSVMQGNTSLLRVKCEEQSFPVQSRSLADINSKGKLVASGASDNILKKLSKSELDLVGNESLTCNIGKDMYSQTNVDRRFGSQLPTVSANPGISLGSLSAMTSANNEKGFRNQGKMEPVSLNISLCKGESSNQLRSFELQPNNTESANLLSDRTNWDLNAPMDSWKGPSGDDGARKTDTHMDVADIKPVICPTGIASMLTQQQILEELERRGKVVANISSAGESVPGSKPSMAYYKPIISEPLDESVGSSGFKAEPMGLLNITRVKFEIIENSGAESLNSLTPSSLNSVDARSLKPEPVCQSNKESPERMEGPDQSERMEGSNQSERMEGPNQSDQQLLAVPTSTYPSLHGGVTTHVEDSMQHKETKPAVEGQVAYNMISSAGHDINEPNIAGEVDNSTSPSKKIKDLDPCTLKSMDVQMPDSRGLVEGSVSDEEKINLSGDVLEEDSYGSDYESDDKRELAAVMDIDHDCRAEDDFEDGEVRGSVDNTEIEVPICEREEAGNENNTEIGFKDFVGYVGDNNSSSSSFREKETQRVDPAITRNDDTNECTNTSVNKDSIADADKEVCMQGSSAVGIPSNQFDEKGHIESIPRTSLDLSEKDTLEGQEGELVSIRTSDMSQGTPEIIGQGADDATNKTDSEGKINSVLPKAEEFSNDDDDAGKDVDSGGTRSRIINLFRASKPSSPGRTRSISGRTLQSQVGRERLPDVALEGDKFHPRGRDEAYVDSSHRFSRERQHLQPSRNNRISFMHGRDLNFSSYNNGQDGAYFGTGRGGTGRGGRKILNDDPSVFPQLPLRRRSPGERDTGHGLQMVRRVPRNLSPSRCIGEDIFEIVGMRNMRGFANDHTDPMFTRCQPSFEGLDGPFVRGNREFTSVQRRGLPRTHSKSPTRKRTRSPGTWSSLRRRSPDEFGGPMELPHRRSSPIYRVERIRSPDRPCFAREMGIRRHGSPLYMSRPSNDLRDLDPGRDHGHPRSGMSNRNRSGRILLRNNRRLDLVDPRERNEVDEYFGVSMPSGRFHELGTYGNAEERKRYGVDWVNMKEKNIGSRGDN